MTYLPRYRRSYSDLTDYRQVILLATKQNWCALKMIDTEKIAPATMAVFAQAAKKPSVMAIGSWAANTSCWQLPQPQTQDCLKQCHHTGSKKRAFGKRR
jgi:hypothetical protein